MKIINLYGGPGSGKSTIAAGLFSVMKIYNYNVELVTEFARDEINSGNHHRLNDQDWLFAHQHHRIKRLDGNVDWCITDSPLLLNLIFSDERWEGKPYLDTWKLFVKQVNDQYINFNYFIQRPSPTNTQQNNHNLDAGRVHDVEQSTLLDQKIITMLTYHNIPYIIIPANEGTVDQLFQRIKLVETFK